MLISSLHQVRAAILTAAIGVPFAVVLLPATPAGAALPSGCIDNGDLHVACQWTAGTASFTVPTSATSIFIEATGGLGAPGQVPPGVRASLGGQGETEGARFPVGPSAPIHGGDTLSLTIGANATGSTGGAPDGGNGGAASTFGTGAGGGGGATSVVNTRSNPDATLIVGGGGGGGGGIGLRDGLEQIGGGGATSNPDAPGSNGENGGGSFFGGGGDGGTTLPGSGGAAGVDHFPPAGDYYAGHAGSAGSADAGGSGAVSDAYGGSGGGGGGGFAGAGGGGSGASDGRETDGGGGGGQGSSYISATATFTSTEVGGDTPQVAIFYDRQPDAVSFTSTPPAPGVVGGTYQVSAIGGGSSEPVMFSSTSPSVCSVAGDQVSFLAAGTCNVDADQDGDANYAPAATVTQGITVVRVGQSVTFDSSPPSDAQVGGRYTPKAIGGASGNPVTISSGSTRICSVSNATVTFKAVGTCIVVAAEAGTPAYNAASATQRIAVHRRTEHLGLSLRSPNSGVLKVNVATKPAAAGLTVTVCRHTHHKNQKLGKAHTNSHGVAVFRHQEKPGSVLHIWVKLAATATTTAARTGINKVRIRGH